MRSRLRPQISPRMRPTVLIAIAGLAVLAIGGATHGWSSVPDVLPVVVVAVVAIHLWNRRDTDAAALARGEGDERQRLLRLQVQALVGRVASLGAAISYLVAAATNTTIWPSAAMLGLVVVSGVAGWAIYGERRGV